jgi:KaiC/GvpD/RAD55 family RecA-like ATPase
VHYVTGSNGLGKTMIAQNICYQAVLAGHSVLFRSAAALLEELHRQTPEGRHRKLRTYAGCVANKIRRVLIGFGLHETEPASAVQGTSF